MRLIRGFALRYVMPNSEIALLLLKNGYKKLGTVFALL